MAGDLLEGLNEDQRAVALCGDNAVVVAGPGSGKSTTLARKAALVLSDPGRRLAAVTFTREAAFELRERVVRYAGMDAAPRLLVGTFHSVMQLQSFPKMRKGNFSAEIIDGAKSGFGRKPWDIVKPGVWRQYVARAMADVGVDADIEFEDAVKIIEWVKSGKAPQERIHEQLVKSYTEIMARNHVIDFQDILLKTIEGLKEGNVSPLNVTDLFIDEYQDTDDIQFQWGREHFKANIRMTAVGDDDQSIYAFRNALGYQGMLRFEKEFGAKMLLLGRNYRSHVEILTSSVNVIRNNLGRIDKRLVSNKGTGGQTRWQTFASRNDEAFAVANLAADIERANQQLDDEDKVTFAVLARTNRRLDEVEAALSKRGIPYRRPPGESILNRPEVAIFGTAIQAILKQDAQATDALLGWNGVSEDDLGKIKRLFNGNRTIGNVEDFRRAGISDEGKKKWQDFVRLFSGWEHSYAAGTEQLLIHGVWEWLAGSAQNNASVRMLEIARDLYSPRKAWPGREAQSIKDRYDALKRAESDRKAKAESKEWAVDLMTAHGSKGLEFESVWIIGAEEDTFPAKDGALEEERRLMYVAMTRAKRELCISTGGGRPPSVFIKESDIARVQDAEQRQTEIAA